MLAQPQHLDPVDPVVTQRARLQRDLPRIAVAPQIRILADNAGQLFKRLGFVLVFHAWSDQVRQGATVQLERFGHHVGGLLLFVVLAGVSDDRHIEQVAGVVGHVEHSPQRSFVLRYVVGIQVLIAPRLGKAGSGTDRHPASGVVGSQMPRARASHGEAPQHDAIGIDLVLLFDGGQRLEYVHLSGELEGVAVPPVRMQDDEVVWSDRSRLPLAAADEIHFAERVAAAVQPDNQSIRFGGVEPLGDHQTVRLDGAVEFGSITAHDVAVGCRPGSRSGRESSKPLARHFQLVAGLGELALVEEIAQIERHPHRTGIDLDVGQSIGNLGSLLARTELADVGLESVQLPGQGLALAGRNLDPGRRDVPLDGRRLGGGQQ